MTWVDLAVLGVLAISGLLAFGRGFVHEVLGIGAWVGAGALAVWLGPELVDRAGAWVPSHPELAQPIAFGGVFLVALVVLLLASRALAKAVRHSAFGGVDRSLGLLFGIARGAVLVAVAYILLQMVVPVQEWPAPLKNARSLPFAYTTAVWLVQWLPAGDRPVVAPPPSDPSPSLASLLRAVPQGRALATPPRRE
ncbi:MAG: CvpA family protein [Rhodospirillales bacterium]|nr:CvpA family protein [Rhodospirillales bacterium]